MAGDAEYADGRSDNPDPVAFVIKATYNDGTPFLKSVNGLDFPTCNELNPNESQEQVRVTYQY
jgi:hypothetical protein